MQYRKQQHQPHQHTHQHPAHQQLEKRADAILARKGYTLTGESRAAAKRRKRARRRLLAEQRRIESGVTVAIRAGLPTPRKSPKGPCMTDADRREAREVRRHLDTQLYRTALAFAFERSAIPADVWGPLSWTDVALCVGKAVAHRFRRRLRRGAAKRFLRNFDFERGEIIEKAAPDADARAASPAPRGHAVCDRCGAPIRWRKTSNGKWQPLQVDSDEPHFDACRATPLAQRIEQINRGSQFVTNPRGLTDADLYHGELPPWEPFTPRIPSVRLQAPEA